MVRPLAYITANWSDNEFEAKSTALRYCRKVYKLIDAVRDIPAKVVSRDKQREQSR